MSTLSRLVLAITLTAVAVVGAVTLPSTRVEAVMPALRVSSTTPAVGETVTFSGRLSTRYQRPVQLQRRDGTRWVRVAAGTAAATGGFVLRTRITAGNKYFRAFAPATKRGRAQSTASRLVKPTASSAALNVVTAPVGQTRTGSAGYTPAEASFKPARAGRPVLLQRLTSGSWQTVARAAQDARGRATMLVKQPASTSTYRAVAPAYRGAAAVSSAPVAPQAWAMSFSDDFSLGHLDTSKWAYRQLGVKPYGNRMCSQSRKEAVSVSGGRLHLRVFKLSTLAGATRRKCPNGFFANGHISTVNDGTDSGNTAIGGGFSTKYGILSARMRFPSAAGQHGSFWSQGGSGTVTGNPTVDGAEIDTAEYYGDGRRDGGLSHLIHWHTRSGQLNSSGGVVNADRLLPRGKEWSDAMHIYSVEWSPRGYVFRVDGHETFRTSKAVSGVSQFMILSLLTSDWELAKLKQPYDHMDVDWVRVWTPPQ